MHPYGYLTGASRSMFGGSAFTDTTTLDLTSLLLSCGIFAAPCPARAAPPRIHSQSRHYRFALYVLAGYPYEDACERLSINPRTAERWRTDLRQTASRYFGRRVTYEFAARYALDATFRHALMTACQG